MYFMYKEDQYIVSRQGCLGVSRNLGSGGGWGMRTGVRLAYHFVFFLTTQFLNNDFHFLSRPQLICTQSELQTNCQYNVYTLYMYMITLLKQEDLISS